MYIGEVGNNGGWCSEYPLEDGMAWQRHVSSFQAKSKEGSVESVCQPSF